LCVPCALELRRQQEFVIRQENTASPFPDDDRQAETYDLEKITGRDRRRREERIARYAACVARGEPIDYVPRTRPQDEI